MGCAFLKDFFFFLKKKELYSLKVWRTFFFLLKESNL